MRTASAASAEIAVLSKSRKETRNASSEAMARLAAPHDTSNFLIGPSTLRASRYNVADSTDSTSFGGCVKFLSSTSDVLSSAPRISSILFAAGSAAARSEAHSDS
eukprot:scaffold33956_cov29-Tisochrysis_lutea.AAC.5